MLGSRAAAEALLGAPEVSQAAPEVLRAVTQTCENRQAVPRMSEDQETKAHEGEDAIPLLTSQSVMPDCCLYHEIFCVPGSKEVRWYCSQTTHC